MTKESRRDRFKRLANLRGERVLRDIRLLGNLSNRNNYECTGSDVRKIFSVIENELRSSKSRFTITRNNKINL